VNADLVVVCCFGLVGLAVLGVCWHKLGPRR
jgi:hypothetical protein